MKKVDQTEVTFFLNDYKAYYVSLLKQLEDNFNSYSSFPGFSSAIYRIYNRGDKQRGDIFKADWMILEKVNRTREGYVTRSKYEVLAKPSFQISDVSDIIGITIVCVYQSDIERISELINTEIGRNVLLSQIEKGSTNQYYYDIGTNGYYARHYILGMRSLPVFQNSPMLTKLWCEVQIKTVLHDAWASKTHDLSYKPYEEFSARIQKQFVHLGETLAAIDKQSEIIKELITEQWQQDNEYKNFSRRAMITRLAQEIKDYKKDYREKVTEIVEDIQNGKRTLCSLPLNEPSLKDLISKIDKLSEDGSHDYDTCRLFGALACLRHDSDLLRPLLDRISRWYFGSGNEAEKLRALIFKGLVLFTFGQLEEAIKISEESLQRCKKSAAADSGAKEWLNKILWLNNNLAYYHSELAGTSVGIKIGAVKKAWYFLQEALAIRNNQDVAFPDAALLDTEGAVLIRCGETADDVRNGLRKCLEARDLTHCDGSEYEMACAFYRLHERKAFRRLLAIEVLSD